MVWWGSISLVVTTLLSSGAKYGGLALNGYFDRRLCLQSLIGAKRTYNGHAGYVGF